MRDAMEERLKLADIGHWSSIKWGTRRGEGCIYLRVYVYQGLSIEQHDAIVTAMYGLTEEGGLPIIEMEEPKLSFNRNGMNWMVQRRSTRHCCLNQPMIRATKPPCCSSSR